MPTPAIVRTGVQEKPSAVVGTISFIFRDIDDTDANRFVADGFEVGEAFEGGGDFILFVRMSGNHDGDGIVLAGAFVLEDA